MKMEKHIPLLGWLVLLFALDGASCAKAQTDATCGDGIRQIYEDCEGTNLAGQSCTSLGQGTGTLSCSADRIFDTTQCSAAARCGDNIRQAGEQCDTDCKADPNCARCQSAGTIDCGHQATGNSADGRAHISSHDCARYDDTGKELVSTFTPAQDGTAQVTLHADNGNDLDLVVTGSLGSDCDPNNCSASQEPLGTDESVSIQVSQNRTYYIIVDGCDGATDTFTLSVTCHWSKRRNLAQIERTTHGRNKRTTRRPPG